MTAQLSHLMTARTQQMKLTQRKAQMRRLTEMTQRLMQKLMQKQQTLNNPLPLQSIFHNKK